MWEILQPFVESLGSSGFGQWIGQSENRIAGLFVMHLAGLTLLLGGTFVIGLRLLDLGLRSQPVAGLARDIAPWRMAGLLLSLVSGALIFTGGAVSYFEGSWFRWKMILLVVALVFNFTAFRIVVYAGEDRFHPWFRRVMGGLTLLVWFSVGLAGRAIAFF
ncbi:MAG TPA: DUF6644 family protein [Terriglobia bacterium]|nr:DUF6644 family protein [Terriglobia bacterium]